MSKCLYCRTETPLGEPFCNRCVWEGELQVTFAPSVSMSRIELLQEFEELETRMENRPHERND